MDLRRLIRKVEKNRFIFIVISIIFLNAFKVSGQIVLADTRVDATLASYYVAEVTDERTDKGPVADLVVRDVTNKITKKALDLQGGVKAEINRYLAKNLQKDKSLSAAILGIKALKITETALPDGSVDGRIKLNLSFGLQKDYGVAPLTASQFALTYRRGASNVTHTEAHIRSILKAGLVYFDNWMKTNAGSDERLAKNVKITFSDYFEKTEGDTIYYSPNRKLTWADFQAPNNSNYGKFLAVVMPSIGYGLETSVNNGTINAHISMNAYLPKSACWVASGGRDEYTLNHEQRHFDIARIIVEQFKQKVLAEKLTPDTFEAFITMQNLDSFRDMDAMQKAYDRETSHGTNRTAQAEWNDRIDSMLKSKFLASPPLKRKAD